MTSEFLVFFRLGMEHISDLSGYDHIMFVAALCAGYEPRHWRQVLILVTAFTVGHSVTLALATLDVVRVNTALVELLIPFTILITSIVNITSGAGVTEEVREGLRSSVTKYALALGFGLIHGLGFSNFLRSMLGESGIAVPLFAFNVGLEVAQVLIVLGLLGGTFVLVHGTSMRLREWTLVLSGATSGVALVLILEQVTAAA